LPQQLSVAARSGFTALEVVGPLKARQAGKVLKLVGDYKMKILAYWSAEDLEPRLEISRILEAEYLPVDSKSDFERLKAVSEGIKVVIYNSIGLQGLGTGPVETEFDLSRMLHKLDFIGLILDLAQLAIASQSVNALLRKYREYLVAVHFNDWTCMSGTGKAYRDGFCRMGAGAVGLKETLRELDRIGYDGWRVVGRSIEGLERTTDAVEGLEFLKTFMD